MSFLTKFCSSHCSVLNECYFRICFLKALYIIRSYYKGFRSYPRRIHALHLYFGQTQAARDQPFAIAPLANSRRPDQLAPLSCATSLLQKEKQELRRSVLTLSHMI